MPSFSVQFAIVIGLLAEPGFQIELSNYVGSQRFDVAFGEDDLMKTPAWKPEAPNPPLSAAEAMRRATDVLNSLAKTSKEVNARKWELRTANLCPVPLDRWYWTVVFEAKTPGTNSPDNSESLRLVVLMNGKAINPRVSTRLRE
jgi:hypothetical protein